MFKPLKMSEVELIILSKDVEEISSMLYDLGIIELKSTSFAHFDKYDHSDSTQITKELLEIRSIITILKEYFINDSPSKKDRKNLLEEVKRLQSQIREIKTKILHLEDEKIRKQVEKGLKITSKELESKDITSGYISLNRKKSLKNLKKRNISFKTFKLGERIYFIAKAPKDSIKLSYTPFYLPKTLEENVQKRLDAQEKKLLELSLRMEKLANSHLEYLRGEERRLSKQISLTQAKNKFSKTKNITLLSGYLPKKSTKRLENQLEKEVGERFELTIKDADESAPTHLEHSDTVSNFENLLQMYSLPKYREIDPTFLMFLIFPLFYGFILGDVIYGLISLLFFTGLKMKMPQIKHFLSILQLSSISSMFFGLIYGEFIGFEFHGAFYGFFERGYHPETLLMIAIIFGLLHINLGVIIGFFNNLQKSFKYALYNNLSWIILQVGLLILALGVYSSSMLSIIIGSILAVFSAVLIYLGHGFAGVIEIPGFFTNILSYARLMAVGLSSIAIAILINEYSVPLFSSGPIGIVGGILLFSLGHIFNIILGNFESFLHTLRLHYVEFFSKFYAGGGREFKPFGKVQ